MIHHRNPVRLLSKKQKLYIAITLAAVFFLTEVVIGFKTSSLALVADAFHVLFDLLSFSIALAAIIISEKNHTPKGLSFGWQRAQLLGSFFNGVFQLALGFSITLMSIDRFIHLEHVRDSKTVLIVASVGLATNIIAGTVLGVHEHEHNDDDDSLAAGQLDLEPFTCHHDLGHRHLIKPEPVRRWTKYLPHSHGHSRSNSGPNPQSQHASTSEDIEQGPKPVVTTSSRKHHDLGTKAVLIHILGDAFNNLGVIISAAIIWKSKAKGRYYADPAMSMFIGIMLLVTAMSIVWRGGKILMLSEPIGVSVEDVQHDLERVPGVLSVHELHIWRLNEEKSCASAHIKLAEGSTLLDFKDVARTMNECLHAYGIHSPTLQPELATSPSASSSGSTHTSTGDSVCELKCGSSCEQRSCCSKEKKLE